ncbi:MAG: hypothetical protein CMC82_03630 [Flavobacteriaceae bacterium]|nr:hypothetical protein [Flavobacteriaceae bacterium]|tara:strand:- start:6735 stop:7598 length:864 start_codon:yes stop_codon:yes gene_type:complete
MNIKHSKYKNTGILFELLVRQITTDTLNGIDSKASSILKEYFVKTELGREYKLYETLFKKTNITETQADVTLSTLLNASKHLNRKALKRQKYNLISEIKKHYDVTKFFSHKLPHYKVQAAFYTLIESFSQETPKNAQQVIDNKITILEHLSAAKIEEEKVKENVLEEFKGYDKDLRILTTRVLLDKFNDKYESLLESQKEILRELITSIDNTPKLREFHNLKVNEIKEELEGLNSEVSDKITKIKVNEVIKMLPTLDKSSKVKDDDLTNLLQYYDLIEELKNVQVQA